MRSCRLLSLQSLCKEQGTSWVPEQNNQGSHRWGASESGPKSHKSDTTRKTKERNVETVTLSPQVPDGYRAGWPLCIHCDWIKVWESIPLQPDSYKVNIGEIPTMGRWSTINVGAKSENLKIVCHSEMGTVGDLNRFVLFCFPTPRKKPEVFSEAKVTKERSSRFTPHATCNLNLSLHERTLFLLEFLASSKNISLVTKGFAEQYRKEVP